MTLTAKAHATFGVLLCSLILIAGQAWAIECTDLKSFVSPNTQITSAAAEYSNFQTPKDGLGNTTRVTLPFCRVTGVAHSVPGSDIHFEVWLPPSGKWNGGMLTSGDLGHSGAPNYPAMNDGLQRGFAAVGDDLGHQSNAFAMDWAGETLTTRPQRRSVRVYGMCNVQITKTVIRKVTGLTLLQNMK